METTVESLGEGTVPVGTGLTFEKVWAMFQETDRRFRETDRKISKLGNRIGELIEHFAASNILEKFAELGFEFNHVSRNHYIKDERKERRAEIDLLLENGQYAAVVEVKSLVTKTNVRRHQKRMEIVCAHMSRHGDGRKYIAAMAGALIEDVAREYALESGMYVVEQSGDNVRVQAPAVPAYW